MRPHADNFDIFVIGRSAIFQMSKLWLSVPVLLDFPPLFIYKFKLTLVNGFDV
jgi:hypothetical protein